MEQKTRAIIYVPYQQHLNNGTADLTIPKRLTPEKGPHIVRKVFLRAFFWVVTGLAVALLLPNTIFPYLFLLVFSVTGILLGGYTCLKNAYYGLFAERHAKPELAKHIQTVITAEAIEITVYLLFYPLLLFGIIR